MQTRSRLETMSTLVDELKQALKDARRCVCVIFIEFQCISQRCNLSVFLFSLTRIPLREYEGKLRLIQDESASLLREREEEHRVMLEQIAVERRHDLCEARSRIDKLSKLLTATQKQSGAYKAKSERETRRLAVVKEEYHRKLERLQQAAQAEIANMQQGTLRELKTRLRHEEDLRERAEAEAHKYLKRLTLMQEREKLSEARRMKAEAQKEALMDFAKTSSDQLQVCFLFILFLYIS